MKFSHILLPIDGSKHSDNATNCTIYLAKMSHARVTVVSCYEWNTHLHAISQMAIDELKDKMQQYASAVVEAAWREAQGRWHRLPDQDGLRRNLARFCSTWPKPVIST